MSTEQQQRQQRQQQQETHPIESRKGMESTLLSKNEPMSEPSQGGEGISRSKGNEAYSTPRETNIETKEEEDESRKDWGGGQGPMGTRDERLAEASAATTSRRGETGQGGEFEQQGRQMQQKQEQREQQGQAMPQRQQQQRHQQQQPQIAEHHKEPSQLRGETKEKEAPTASVAEYLSSKSQTESDKTSKGKLLEKIREERKHQGKEHRDMLLNLVGEWTAHYEFAGPETGGVHHGKGEMTCKPLFEGDFIEMNYCHKTNDFEYLGKGLFSYSPHQNEFHSTWLDNTSSSMHPSHGRRMSGNKPGFELNSFSTFPDFFSGKNKTTRQTLEFDEDLNCLTYCAYDKVEGEGEEKKTMHIVYTRKGSPRETRKEEESEREGGMLGQEAKQ